MIKMKIYAPFYVYSNFRQLAPIFAYFRLENNKHLGNHVGPILGPVNLGNFWADFCVTVLTEFRTVLFSS